MFEDPELPDFDSMSQEELIEWLEELAKIQGAASSEFIDDDGGADGGALAEDPIDESDEAWSAWLDESPDLDPALSATSENGDDPVGDNFEDADEETPVDLPRFDRSDRGPLDARGDGLASGNQRR